MRVRKITYKNIDEYILEFPESTQKKLSEVRSAIKEAAPDSTEAISYQIPTFKLNGNLVHFAGYKNHIGFYPGSQAIEEFKKDIEKYKWAKGTVQFPLENPLPIALIKKITKFRVAKNLKK